MKTFAIACSIMLMLSINLFTQNNYFIDNQGDTIWYGGVPEITPEVQARIDAIPELVITAASKNTTLPYKVDNQYQPWMRPIFQQTGGSCSQAAAIGYTFTYEINRLRGIPANDSIWYPPGFTYNYLNNGEPQHGSYPDAGFTIVKESGCPTVEEYGGMYLSSTTWISGYDKYRKALENRVKKQYTIKPFKDDGFNDFKHWLNDHGVSDSSGGLAVFTVDSVSPPMLSDQIKEGEAVGDEIIVDWIGVEGNDTVAHTMTIVGYNDSIKYDFNGDSVYTADEYGAIKVANSWGGGWMNQGYVYVSYKMFKELETIDDNLVYVIEADTIRSPEIVLKAEISHRKRQKLSISANFSENADSTSPNLQYRKDFSAFDYRGGPYPMRGYGTFLPLEMALDYSYWFADSTVGKVFLHVYQVTHDTGSIRNFSLIDYRWGETVEVDSDVCPVVTNFGFNTLSINYDVLPFNMAPLDLGTSIYNITSDKVVRKQTVIKQHMTVNIESFTQIDFYNSELVVEEGATLNIGQYVQFVDKTGNSKLTINGDVNFGSNISFKSEGENQFIVKFKNQSDTIKQVANNFENCEIHSYADSVYAYGSSFTDCGMIYSYRGGINIDSCEFSNSGLYFENSDRDEATLVLAKNKFNTNENLLGVSLWSYDYFDISDNTFNGYYDGIQVMQTGHGSPNTRTISGNTVSASTNAGIVTFNSGMNLYENIIKNNYDGIRVLNNSTISIYGNGAATDFSETNQVKNNSRYELYASTGSFPWYFKYNLIDDADNTGNPVDPHIYYQPSGIPETLDVSYNCWDNSFDATEDLYPSGSYNYLPTWCPSEGGNKSSDIALQTFTAGLEEFENGEYEDAKQTFKEVIEQYPQTTYASAAMKEMFALEPFTDNNFLSLQQYYNTNDSIQADSALVKLALFMSNKCEIELESWQTAIDYFEDIIENPNSPEDSIFAIIDLGYTYFLMENNGQKSSAKGSMLQHKPINMKNFTAKRDTLLAMLPFTKSTEKTNEDLTSEKIGELSQNVPNPFMDNTQISYNLVAESNVELHIYNYSGQLIKTINEGRKIQGTHIINFNASGFRSGIYFYSISVNGRISDLKKMTVIN